MIMEQDRTGGLRGQTVVLDLVSPYVVLGLFTEADDRYLTLINADIHDLRDSKITRELYVLQAREHGIRANRKRVLIRTEEVVALSRLDEVIV